MYLARRFARCSPVVFSVMMLAFSAHADDGAVSEVSGGTIAPLDQHPSVRMVSEVVTVRIVDGKSYVHCEFVFRNEGKATTVKMGFPEHAWGGGDGGAFMRIKGFKTWVDGKTTKVAYKPANNTRPKISGGEEYKAWYVKDVRFAKGQTRKVVDEYYAKLGSEGGAGSPYDKISIFDYVLKTGSTWKGPIGKAVVIVDASTMTPYCDINAGPAGYSNRGGILTWSLVNIEPKDDIHVELLPRCPKLNGKTVDGWWWWPYSVDNGIIMAGPRFIQEMGGSVGYDPHTYVCTIRYGGRTLKLTGRSKVAVLDGSRKIKMPRALWYREGYDTCAIPVTAVVKALGGRTEYDRKALRLNVWLKDLSEQH